MDNLLLLNSFNNNMKQRIMEALLSSDNNLSKDEINWAIANIPNDGATAKPNDTAYNHDADNIWDACGYSDDKLVALSKEYVKLREDSPGDKKSMFIEYFMQNASRDIINLFIIKGIQHHEQKAHDKMFEDLKALIDKLGK